MVQTIYGLDIYSGQGKPNMRGLYEEGHEFCFSKANGEGDYVNPFWRDNRDAALAAGMVFGTYDWVEPQSGMTGVAAAMDYLNQVGQRAKGQMLNVDYETPDWWRGPFGRDIEGFMKPYLYTLRDVGMQEVLVYTARYFLQETGAESWDWLGRDFLYWQAAPGPGAMMPDDSFWPLTTAPFQETLVHQHQWHATSQYVRMEFDRNRFRGTAAELAGYGWRGGVLVPVPDLPYRKELELTEPTAGKVTWYVNEHSEPIFAWNGGGQTRRIDGVNIQDLGMTVESFTEPGKLLDISIKGNTAGDYHERPAPEAFVADPRPEVNPPAQEV